MSMYATIYNIDFEPLTDGEPIENDADFSGMENKDQEYALNGTKCCIRWSRDSDGQIAYWGPEGAIFKPYWYVKQGRPEEMQGGKRRNVYLDDASWTKALELGTGNASDGIRKALSNAA